LKANPDLLSRGGTWVNRIEEYISEEDPFGEEDWDN
jgi:hypothetical protein